MRSYTALARIVETILILLPIAYGLSLYNWDIQYMITPSYVPPRIDFSIEKAVIRMVSINEPISIDMYVVNRGEIPIKIVGFEAEIIYAGNPIGVARLKSPLMIRPGEEGDVTLIAEIRDITSIVKGFVEGHRIVELSGRIRAEVFGASIEMPLNTTIPIEEVFKAHGGLPG